MPWPAPVMIATLPSSRPMSGHRTPVDQVELLGEDWLARGLVAPGRLDDDERHRGALALLLVDVEHGPLADEHVADLDGPVVLELLLAVQDHPALGKQ